MCMTHDITSDLCDHTANKQNNNLRTISVKYRILSFYCDRAMDGICHIKPEFLVKNVKTQKEQYAEVKQPENTEPANNDALTVEANEEPLEKKQRLSNREHKRLKKGQNKARPLPFKTKREENLCKSLYNGPNSDVCKFENCKFVHDLDRFLAEKPKDIGPMCPIYSTKGFCARGLTCRFANSHIDENRNNCRTESYNERTAVDSFNYIPSELQIKLRKKLYDFGRAKELVKKYFKSGKTNESKKETAPVAQCLSNYCTETNEINADDETQKRLGYAPDYDVVKERAVEKRQVDFRDKLLLSPLTTVGNLPFRRICKEFGADITSGEMACVVPLINGISQEWALARRHKSEDIFGVQLCGNSSELIAYATQLLSENCDIDFFDLNIGCPIELIYSQGGSALIRRTNVLETIVRSCSELLNGTPFTVKTRTGIYANKNVAHELVPKFESWGAKAVTVHGRSREQRYTRKSDWSYIEECARQSEKMPIIGNGDILSYDDYVDIKNVAPHVASVMIGRGALIKPWIFSEIKEGRAMDISSKERFEIIRKYMNYGLEHWGSDTQGVETTRRFFLEWQSFMYRYVPYGLLERPPQRINQRPDSYYGRDDLETLMASPNCSDWIKLSEMLLGPVPENYHFLPKHKANAY